jgi:hypothetical protein
MFSPIEPADVASALQGKNDSKIMPAFYVKLVVRPEIL